MSLLMDALKQAEHAKRATQPGTLPPEPQAAQPSVRPSCAERRELSLAPADVTPRSVDTLELAPVNTPAAEADAEQAQNSVSPAFAAEPDAAHTPQANASSDTYRHATQATSGAQAAARILAASAARHTAQRRRNLFGLAGLTVVVGFAIGGYYYYAALAQPEPYLNLPPAGVAQASAPADAEPAAVAPAADETVQSAAIQDSTSIQEAPGLDQPPPAHTPWREGPPPPEPLITQDWQPAPVDPRVLRGEKPLSAAVAQAEENPAPVAASAASIRITRGSRANEVNFALLNAYEDYRAGNWAEAEAGYRLALAAEPGNRDARLGLAALAVRAGRLDAARDQYRELLRSNPKDAAAHAALTGLEQSRAPHSESELKLLLAEQPRSAALHFALATLYAGQQRWPQAQQAYFEALRLAPEQPDYAFNLAVSLEHLDQPRLAVEFYQRALNLARTQAAQFDHAVAQQRIAALGAKHPS